MRIDALRSATSLALAAALAVLTPACAGPPAPSVPAPAESPPWRLPPPGDLPRDRALRAGFLVVDGVYDSELMAPYDVFHHTPFHTDPDPGIEVFTVSPDGEPVVTFEGLTLVPHHGFDDAPEIDILVVPSAEGSMDADLENQAMIDWVRRVGSRARFVVSLCDGAFILARAGLLDGRTVTTFPADQDRFAEMFPGPRLVRGPGFVHDGPVLTSQGGVKSYDVAMYLVDHLYGEAVARGVGRGLVLEWPPREVPGISILRTPRGSSPDPRTP